MDDSIQLLLKRQADGKHEETAHMPLSPDDDTPASSKDPATEQLKDIALSEKLQYLSKIMLELLNEDDPLSHPHAHQYLVDTYKSEASIPDSGMKAESSDNHFANVAEYRKRNPNYHIEIYDTTAHVNRDTGRAMVWATSRVTGLPGLPPGATRESVTAIHWKKQPGGSWVLFRTTGMRGPGDYT